MCDGKKPEAPPPTPPAGEKDALGDLLGAADKDLEFNPADIQFSGGLD